MNNNYNNNNNNDGPLGKAPEINVGVSDSIIIGVSLVGFCFLAYTLYNIVIKVKSSRELESEDLEGEKSFEEMLAQADVSTLTRAQRRARARHIMKQQRRAGDDQQVDDGGGDEQQVEVDMIIPQHENQDNHPSVRNLKSRKERQKVAKEIEIQQRKLLESDRLKEQQIAQEEALRKKKEREESQKIQFEKEKQRRLEEFTKKELIEYHRWKTFLPPPTTTNDDDIVDDPTKLTNATTTNSITVKEFIAVLEKRTNKSISIQELSDQYHTPKEDIIRRIQQLIDCGRLTGILSRSSGRFTYLSPHDMLSLATSIKQRGDTDQEINTQWLRTQIQQQVMIGG
jgi:hypothetical protein